MSLLKKTLAGCFTGSLAAANVVASKITAFSLPLVGTVTAPAGFLGIGLAFLFSDLLGELFGEEEAREVVNGAIVALLAVYGVVYSAVLLPAAPFYGAAESFNAIMSSGTTIVVASIMTLLVSQNVDVSIFHALKRRGGPKFVRNIASTGISQIVDTALFIGLAFVVLPLVLPGTAMGLAAAASLALTQYAAKVAVVALDTPLFYLGTALAER